MANSFGTYALTDIAAQVMGRDARFGARASVPLLGADEFTRYWKVDAHLSERVRAFLDLYGDGDHFVAASPLVETHAITNPAAEQDVAVPGLWRVVRNFEEPDQPGTVFQTLRLGFLRPPSISGKVWGAAGGADGEGRVYRVQQVAADVQAAFGTHYVVIYPHVDKTYVREFCAELIARGTIDNPVFDKQTAIPGSYTFRAARNTENDDGTSTVMGILASTETPPGLEVLMYDGCAAKEWVRFFYDLASLPPVPVSTSGVEYRLQNVSLDRETGMWSCTLVREETKTLSLPRHTAAEDLYTRRERSAWQQVREGDVDHLGEPVPLETPGIAADGAVVDIARSKNRNCAGYRTDREHELEVLAAERTSRRRSSKPPSRRWTVRGPPARRDGAAATGGGAQRARRGPMARSARAPTREQPVTMRRRRDDVSKRSKLDKAQPLATDLSPGGLAAWSSPSAGQDARRAADVRPTPTRNRWRARARPLFERGNQLDKAQPLATDLTARRPRAAWSSPSARSRRPALLDVTTDTDTDSPCERGAEVRDQDPPVETRRSKPDKAQPLATDLTAPAASGGVVDKRGSRRQALRVTTPTRATRDEAEERDRTLRDARSSSTRPSPGDGPDGPEPRAAWSTKRGSRRPARC